MITLTCLSLYNFMFFSSAILFKWWFAIVIIFIAGLYIRHIEKDIWKDEIKKSNTDESVKDLCIKPNNIVINLFISFIIAKLIMFVNTGNG